MNEKIHYGSKKDVPQYWYNITAKYPDLYIPDIDGKTMKNVTEDSLSNIFPKGLIEQELNNKDVHIPIPEEVVEKYCTWRPTPLVRAYNLERELKTKCKIYYKYEGVSPIGSHKANSAVAQAYYCKADGIKKIVAETGAGQWGSAASMAASFYGLDCLVYMVKNSYDAKPARRIMMQSFGSEVLSSPTNKTNIGRKTLAENPDSQGSLGLAIAEAVETASGDSKTAYSLGSAMNFVCLHQTVIGNELKKQLENIDEDPNYIISCIGGGSSFAGISFPFLEDKLEKNKDINFIAVESNAVPSVTKGKFMYDYGDSGKSTPLSKMYTLGHDFSAPSIHAGGLRYHGLSPLVSKFIESGHASARAYSQLEIFTAALLFARCEGYIPAPESAHSIKAAIDVALENKDEEKTIVFCLTGHGFFDLSGYERFLKGEMSDSTSPDRNINESLAKLDKELGQMEFNKDTSIDYDTCSSNTQFDDWWGKYFQSTSQCNQKDSFISNASMNNSGDTSTNSRSYDANYDGEQIYDIITENKVQELINHNQKVIFVSKKSVITPLAEELIRNNSIDVKIV